MLLDRLAGLGLLQQPSATPEDLQYVPKVKDGVTAVDLTNAYGCFYRSVSLREAHANNLELAAWAATEWSNGWTRCWQVANGKWIQHSTSKGFTGKAAG